MVFCNFRVMAHWCPMLQHSVGPIEKPGVHEQCFCHEEQAQLFRSNGSIHGMREILGKLLVLLAVNMHCLASGQIHPLLHIVTLTSEAGSAAPLKHGWVVKFLCQLLVLLAIDMYCIASSRICPLLHDH